MTRHVAVLMGGWSVEREVSLVSGEACAAALERLGHQVTRIDVDRDLAARLRELRPDVAFNALHGRIGEDGRVQGLLDILQIPYTHSGVLASALAMDKPMAIRLLRCAGLTCPEGVTMTLGELLAAGSPLAPPFVVKPAAEGSSVGVHLALDGDLSPLERRNDRDAGALMLVEPYVPGIELTCGVLDDEPLAVTELRPREGFYDYRAKYSAGLTDHVIPAGIPDAIYERVLRWAQTAHRALGCRGVSRSDFRFNPEASEGDGLFFLEVNTQPGMTPLSLLPEQAAFRGVPFDDLVARILASARCDG